MVDHALQVHLLLPVSNVVNATEMVAEVLALVSLVYFDLDWLKLIAHIDSDNAFELSLDGCELKFLWLLNRLSAFYDWSLLDMIGFLLRFLLFLLIKQSWSMQFPIIYAFALSFLPFLLLHRPWAHRRSLSDHLVHYFRFQWFNICLLHGLVCRLEQVSVRRGSVLRFLCLHSSEPAWRAVQEVLRWLSPRWTQILFDQWSFLLCSWRFSIAWRSRLPFWTPPLILVNRCRIVLRMNCQIGFWLECRPSMFIVRLII